jgi:hypothetical protein
VAADAPARLVARNQGPESSGPGSFGEPSAGASHREQERDAFHVWYPSMGTRASANSAGPS